MDLPLASVRVLGEVPLGGGVANKYRSLVAADNGVLYAAPCNAPSVYKCNKRHLVEVDSRPNALQKRQSHRPSAVHQGLGLTFQPGPPGAIPT